MLRAPLAAIGLALLLAWASRFLPLSRETYPLLAPPGEPWTATTAPSAGQLIPSSQFAAPQFPVLGVVVMALALLPACLVYLIARK
jgi:hypothetical protein